MMNGFGGRQFDRLTLISLGPYSKRLSSAGLALSVQPLGGSWVVASGGYNEGNYDYNCGFKVG